jgi:hypothetical protein
MEVAVMPASGRSQDKDALRRGRETARRARRGLRLKVPPTSVHPDRRRRLREAWQRTIAEEVGAAWPR